MRSKRVARQRLTTPREVRRDIGTVVDCKYRFLDSPDGHASPEVWEGQR